jgi:hypothetical protein
MIRIVRAGSDGVLGGGHLFPFNLRWSGRGEVIYHSF